MLITITARVTRSHGPGQNALPAEGIIEYQPAAPGIWEGALRAQDPVVHRITGGAASGDNLTPGPWRVTVIPELGPAWDPWLIELGEDGPADVDLADLTPVLVIDGERWTTGPQGTSVVGVRDNGDQTVTWLFSDGTESVPFRIAVGPEGEQGDRGDQGASVTGAIDHGDGTVSFTLSDGGETDPVVMPPGPAGRGITAVSDPDADSNVTITYSDGTTSTVQAVRGRPGEPGDPGDPGEPGQDGHTPTFSWDGTALVIDGETGPDLKGEQGEGADVDWDTLDGKPETFTPAAHTHAVSEINGLDDAITSATDGLATTGEVADAVGGLASEAYADQAAADAVATVPDASPDRRGMMPAASARDLERLTTEPLSRRTLRTALEAQRATGVGVIFAGSSTIEGDKATSTDRRPVQRISGYLTPRPAQSAVSGSTPADGVQVWAWGIGGSTSANYLTSSHYTAVGSIKPVLMVHVVGSNDWSGSRTPSQYDASMRAHLDALRSASPDTVHLLIGQHQRNSPASGSHPWTDYTDVLRTLAEEDPDRVEFLDLWGRYAAVGIPGADPWGWLYSDGIHLTDESYRILADWIAEHLGVPTPSGAAELYTGTLTGGSGKNSGDVILSATIPAKPYPRQGTVQGTVYARKRASLSETRLKVGDELLIVRPTIPTDTSIDGISPPLVHRVIVPAHEEMTVQVIHAGNDNAYYSNNTDWGNLAVQIAAC